MYRIVFLVCSILFSTLSHSSEYLINYLKKQDAIGSSYEPAFQLGVIYRGAADGNQDCVASVSWFKRSAELGSLEAINELGKIYGKGCGSIKKDLVQSEAYLTEAANIGLDSAQNNLGFLLVRGWGGAGRQEEGLSWLLKAADQEYVKAYFNLGYFYQQGISGTKDLDEARKWYEKAAAGGHRKAAVRLKQLGKQQEKLLN